VAADVRPWFLGSLTAVVGSGVLLFLSEAVKCYNSAAFQVKVSALAAVIILTALSHRHVTSDAALVAWGGRWIGLS
jgi:hypothetical protein